MDENSLREFFANDRYAALTGAEVVKIAPGYCLCKLSITEKHLNAVNVVQGGAIFTLADFAFAIASNSGGQLALAIDVNISFLAARSGGTLYAEAQELTTPGRIGAYEVKVTDQDNILVAQFNGLVYRKNQPLSSE
jgi:acyl-CoA thioesterase